MNRIAIRPATSADLVAVAAIYSHCVLTSTATFDLDEPPLSTWRAKLDSTAVGDHFLVAHSLVAGDGDTVLGYAYSGAFRSRPAYRHTRETSVYLAPEAMGSGHGTRLYSDLLDLLRKDGVHLVVAVVTQPNPPSNALHRKLGVLTTQVRDTVGW